MTRIRRHSILLGAALVSLCLALAGCAVARVEQATPDAFETWSLTPLPPDPALAVMALGSASACRGGAAEEPIRILVQDRRTASTAAFLTLGASTFGSCIVSAGGVASGGSGPLPEAMSGPLTIDDNGGGGVAGFEVRELGGRVAGGASVRVQLADGRLITASVENGYWLAWWPGLTLATQVVATDSTGTDIATVQVPS